MEKDNKRDFLKKVLVGVPIVIASSAKPVWGMNCLSGMMSGNMSGPQPQCNITSGLSSVFWQENYIGSQDEHYRQNDPSSSVIKRKLRNYDGHYFVKVGKTYHFSDMLTNSYFGSATCQNSLTSSDEFICEIVTARINASIPILNYIYSIKDVEDIYHTVLSGQAEERNVLGILQQIHQS